jgi:hypothetical protein
VSVHGVPALFARGHGRQSLRRYLQTVAKVMSAVPLWPIMQTAAPA